MIFVFSNCNENNEIGVFHSNRMEVEILNDKYFLERAYLLAPFGSKERELIYEDTLIKERIHLPKLDKYRFFGKKSPKESLYLIFSFAQKENLDCHVNSILKLDYNNLYLKDSTFVLEKFKS